MLTRPQNLLFLLALLTQIVIRGYYARRTKQNEKTVRRVDALEKFLLLLVIPKRKMFLEPLLVLRVGRQVSLSCGKRATRS